MDYLHIHTAASSKFDILIIHKINYDVPPW